MQKIDRNYSYPVEIAEDIFWVGEFLPEDCLQCNVYLIRNGKESVLIDPGSICTFEGTIQKIRYLIDPCDIKYLICHSQTPDATSCIGVFEKRFPREDRFVVTHWRTASFLKHYGWKTPFWIIDEHDWHLKLSTDRTLHFIFTPYIRCPGAFCTYDEKTRILFSGGLFGGYTKKFSLFAEDESYFETLKLFHEQDIPSQEILEYILEVLSHFKFDIIAPQHGSIIPPHLVPSIISKLRTLECGLFLLSYNHNFSFLPQINRILRKFFEILVQATDLRANLLYLHKLIREILPVKMILVMTEIDEDIFVYSSHISFPPERVQNLEIRKFYLDILRLLKDKKFAIYTLEYPPFNLKPSPTVCLVLHSMIKEPLGVALFFLEKDYREKFFDSFFEKCATGLSLVLERERKYISLHKEREKVYSSAVKDPLTGLYNRFYLWKNITSLFEYVQRYKFSLSVIMFDLDHFKKINDLYGHLIGDKVLQKVAQIILENIRKEDFAVRYGGEEFLVITPYTKKAEAAKIAERIRKIVENTPFNIEGKEIKITLSAGVAKFKDEKNLESLIEKADSALYRAKREGRNRVVVAD